MCSWERWDEEENISYFKQQIIKSHLQNMYKKRHLEVGLGLIRDCVVVHATVVRDESRDSKFVVEEPKSFFA